MRTTFKIVLLVVLLQGSRPGLNILICCLQNFLIQGVFSMSLHDTELREKRQISNFINSLASLVPNVPVTNGVTLNSSQAVQSFLNSIVSGSQTANLPIFSFNPSSDVSIQTSMTIPSFLSWIKGRK